MGTATTLGSPVTAAVACSMEAKTSVRHSFVRRLASEPAFIADDVVRARNLLLRLLRVLCQAQEKEQLAALCQRYRLQSLMRHVLLEEKRKQRVILIEIASQLLELFQKVLPAEAVH